MLVALQDMNLEWQQYAQSLEAQLHAGDAFAADDHADALTSAGGSDREGDCDAANEQVLLGWLSDAVVYAACAQL